MALFEGTADADIFQGSRKRDRIYGYGGDDELHGGAGFDLIFGGDGNDRIFGGSGADSISGEAGDDDPAGGKGDDSIDGGFGDDTLSGGDGDDKLYGGYGSDTMMGGDGAYSLRSYSFGGEEADILDGGAGYDQISANYNDTVIGGADSASLTLNWRNRIGRFVGTFGDQEVYANGTGTISGVNDIHLFLTDRNDDLRADGTFLRTVQAGRGDDILRAGDASISLFGEAGDDQLFAGNAPSGYYGGYGNAAGYDSLSYADAAGPINVVRVFGVSNPDNADIREVTRTNGDATFVDHIAEIDTLIATGFDDAVEGADGTVKYRSLGRVSGYYHVRGGEDHIDGGAGDDVIKGNFGSDVLLGGLGNDTLDGGQDDDTLTGGEGADRFVFRTTGDLPYASGFYVDSGGPGRAADVITDFDAAEGDRIDLSSLDADSVQAGRQAPMFIGNGLPTGVAGQMWYTTADGGLDLHIDRNGDQVSDYDIRLDNVETLTASDFIL